MWRSLLGQVGIFNLGYERVRVYFLRGSDICPWLLICSIILSAIASSAGLLLYLLVGDLNFQRPDSGLFIVNDFLVHSRQSRIFPPIHQLP